MKPPDYELAAKGLRQNLITLANPNGDVPADNRALWNVSQAMIEMVAALESIEERLRIVERMLSQ
jgi:hypothetical protein